MSTEENRRNALNIARDSGEPAATYLLTLLSGKYRGCSKRIFDLSSDLQIRYLPANVESRRENLRGFIYSPFRAGDFLAEIHNSTKINDLKIKIYDGEPSESNLLTASNINNSDFPTPAMNEFITTRNQINVAGRNWTSNTKHCRLLLNNRVSAGHL